MARDLVTFRQWRTAKKDEIFLATLDLGYTISRACARAGYDRAMVDDEIKSSPVFARAVDGARRTGRETILDKVIDASDGLKETYRETEMDRDGNVVSVLVRDTVKQNDRAILTAAKMLAPEVFREKIDLTVRDVKSDDKENEKLAMAAALDFLAAKQKEPAP